MTVGSILLGVALLIVVGLVVMRPFLAKHAPAETGVGQREALQAQKEAILQRIRDLDFDHETGKMPDGEHQRLRQQLLSEAAAILQRLDALEPAAAPSQNGSKEAESEIEAAIRRLREVPSSPPDSGDAVESAVKQLRRERAAANGPRSPEAVRESGGGSDAGRYCSQCGRQRDPGDKFCAYCGHPFS